MCGGVESECGGERECVVVKRESVWWCRESVCGGVERECVVV